MHIGARRAALGTTAAIAATLTACTAAPSTPVTPGTPAATAIGDVPANQAYVPFTPPDHSFTVSVPAGWSMSTQDTATVFTGGVDSVSIDTASTPQAPTVNSVTTDVIPVLQATTTGFALGGVTAVTRPSGTGILISYEVRSPSGSTSGQSITLDVQRYELWHHAHEAIVALSSPMGTDNIKPWRTITDSLHWLD